MSQAIYLLNNRDESYQFRTGAEVLKVSCLQGQGSQVSHTHPDPGPGTWRTVPPCPQVQLTANPSPLSVHMSIQS